MRLSQPLLYRLCSNALQQRMRFGVVVTDDDPLWGGEQGVGDYFVKRFKERSIRNGNGCGSEFKAIHAVTGKLPDKQDINSYDGFLLTGSHFSVNQKSPWIRRLEQFIRNAYQASLEHGRPRMVGICFGHQVIAKALGGVVASNPDKRFHFGSADVKVDEAFLSREFANNVSFMKRPKSTITMMKFHGECVVERPRIALPIGTSEQCKHEILMYGNTVLTTQGHPEYTKQAMEEINAKIMSRIGRLSEDQIRDNLDAIVEDDVDNCTDMISAFLHHVPVEVTQMKKESQSDYIKNEEIDNVVLSKISQQHNTMKHQNVLNHHQKRQYHNQQQRKLSAPSSRNSNFFRQVETGWPSLD